MAASAARQPTLKMMRKMKDTFLAVQGEARVMGFQAEEEVPRWMGDPPVAYHLEALLALEMEEVLLGHLE